MQYAKHDFDKLAREHHVLMRDYGRVQLRCSEQLHAQALEIKRLEAQVMRLRADVVLRVTALAWEREDRAALEAAIPGLPKRITLVRHVETLLARIQVLMRERLHWERPHGAAPPVEEVAPLPAMLPHPDGPEALEASLHAADLVICQTGCLSHGDYWRVQDYCKRMNKTCVLVEQAEVLGIARTRKAGAGELQVLSLASDPSGTSA
ncbi:DUF2325 domain-containing protein [Thauera linaloolentis]|uniref:DUF2325 domain-containing protein n=1 Tax=Thauera linaloolentis (strain DSM 12138 / JCM 21573 / CCUG 41526 / CIP 105981 / IAM 15112 / NBRC 102519 / 47Lol) TaxID=1123367 RepID=N6Z7U5_THAL4|nr:DUF2325 domain-containing protein [Thauera linaloolentis]ENO90378.1 hypothetical protein C666_01850 [Thauera linaloolentis 47Lol = DSM 12138]MCM8564047.1 DUF2325 domain-containing protein [Thauera linaloolentis]